MKKAVLLLLSLVLLLSSCSAAATIAFTSGTDDATRGESVPSSKESDVTISENAPLSKEHHVTISEDLSSAGESDTTVFPNTPSEDIPSKEEPSEEIPSEVPPSEEQPSKDEPEVVPITLVFDSVEQLNQMISSDELLKDKRDKFFTTAVPTAPELQFEGYEIRRIEFTYSTDLSAKGRTYISYQRIDIYWYQIGSEGEDYAFCMTNVYYDRGMPLPTQEERVALLTENGYTHLVRGVYVKELGEYTKYHQDTSTRNAYGLFEIKTDLADKQLIFDGMDAYYGRVIWDYFLPI